MTHGGRSQETFLIQSDQSSSHDPLSSTSLGTYSVLFYCSCSEKNPLVSSTVLNTSESKKSVCFLAQANHQEKDLCKRELV